MSPPMPCVALSIKKHSAKAHPKGSRALGLRSLGNEQMARNVLDVSGCRLRNWILLSLSL